MAKRVTLDAMIPREDFAVSNDQFELELFRDFPITNLSSESPILKLLRKPDFQRETNHWTPEQVVTFIASFLDNEVIPSLILWKSPSHIFVIDGGHRLSALRAWVEDDYGDGHLSLSFYKGEISVEQKAVAKRTRTLIEQRIGRYTALRALVDSQTSDDPVALRRANRLFTRPLNLQWIQGNSEVAETSFFKINSQGTPLDDVEEMLIRNRRKPIAIAARAILRSGTGHKYWSSFDDHVRREVESAASTLFDLLFEPEASTPIRTLDVPFGGSVSPVEALGLLIDLLSIAGSSAQSQASISETREDPDGQATVTVLRRASEVLDRITGNSAGSLGLHPAVYFYNDRGKYNRFLFLGVVSMLTSAVRNNDRVFFRKFTEARAAIEQFLLANKNLIGLVLQNMSKGQRVPRMRQLLEYLIQTYGKTGQQPALFKVLEEIGVRGRVLDMGEHASAQHFTDDVKSKLFIASALQASLKCPICGGYLLPSKSVSFDHIVRCSEGGMGDDRNGRMTHPYCNTGYKA